MEMEKVSFTEAVLFLAKKSGVEVIYDSGNFPAVEEENPKEQYIDLYGRVSGTYHFFLNVFRNGKGRSAVFKTTRSFRRKHKRLSARLFSRRPVLA